MAHILCALPALKAAAELCSLNALRANAGPRIWTQGYRISKNGIPDIQRSGVSHFRGHIRGQIVLSFPPSPPTFTVSLVPLPPTPAELAAVCLLCHLPPSTDTLGSSTPRCPLATTYESRHGRSKWLPPSTTSAVSR